MSKQTKKTPAKRRVAKPAPKRPSTALARRVEVLPAVVPPQPVALTEVHALTDETQLGALGLVEIKLTAQEELVLSREVSLADIRVKPSGIAYVSHPTYTRWFNEAFGRLGWAIVPRSKPMKSEKTISCAYVLYIHGQPAAFAIGEQDYFADNANQSYGDALEATIASALRRCAKRLGVGLELWDKAFIDDYMHTHAVRVKVKDYRGEVKDQWRRKVDAPLKGEIGVARDEYAEEQRQNRPAPPPQRQQAPVERADYVHKGDESVITRQQQDRLFTIVENSGRIESVVAKWLNEEYGYARSSLIQKQHYEEIVSAVKAEGALRKRVSQ